MCLNLEKLRLFVYSQDSKIKSVTTKEMGDAIVKAIQKPGCHIKAASLTKEEVKSSYNSWLPISVSVTVGVLGLVGLYRFLKK
jgi:hypothetical protein